MTVRKLPLFVVLVCLAVLGQQQPNPNFTGKVTRLEETPAPQIGYFRFEPGAD